jgi:hypothetical protein
VRPGELGGNIELELLRILDVAVSQSNGPHVSLLVNLLSKKWLNHWVKLLSCILEDDWIAERNAVFEDSAHNLEIHGWLDALDISVFLHTLDPVIALHLWINHQRPSL